MKYKAKPVLTQAIQLDMPITYEKWGGTQHAKAGDWLLSKKGETYTCDADVFAETYRRWPTPMPGWFYKDASVLAYVAVDDGSVSTLEGSSAFKAGDYIVTNPGGGQYVIKQADFEGLYETA